MSCKRTGIEGLKRYKDKKPVVTRGKMASLSVRKTWSEEGKNVVRADFKRWHLWPFVQGNPLFPGRHMVGFIPHFNSSSVSRVEQMDIFINPGLCGWKLREYKLKV